MKLLIIDLIIKIKPYYIYLKVSLSICHPKTKNNYKKRLKDYNNNKENDNKNKKNYNNKEKSMLFKH